MAMNKARGRIGYALQDARGTLAAAPEYAHGITSGAPGVNFSDNLLPVTAVNRVPSVVTRDGISVDWNTQHPAYLATLGLLLQLGLGKRVTTGSADPYTHVFTADDLPYGSIFRGLSDGNEAMADAKLDQLTLKWSKQAPLEVEAKFKGCALTLPTGAFSPAHDVSGSEDFLIPVGGTFTVDVIGDTPVAVRVSDGEIGVNNNVGAIIDSTILNDADQFEGRSEHDIKLTVIPEDLELLKKAVTGTADGTEVSPSIVYGSFSMAFVSKSDPTNHGLVVEATKVAFKIAFPNVDPKGGAMELALAGVAVSPDGEASPVTYTLKNDVAAYGTVGGGS